MNHWAHCLMLLALAPSRDEGAAAVVLPNLGAVGFDERYLLPRSIIEHERSVVRRIQSWVDSKWQVRGADGTVAERTTGDLVAAIRNEEASKRAAARARVLEGAGVTGEARAIFDALLDDARITRADWNPDEGHDDDGLWEPAPLVSESSLGIPGAGDSITFRQGAALLFADMKTIKRVERDFTKYPARAGTDYESIEMTGGSKKAGEVKGLGPVVAYHCDFISDLPFPFGTYRCDLAVIDRLDDAGRLRCDIHAAGGDFHFMTGCDVYIPLRTSDGVVVAWCVSRIFSFDLDGVPDGDSDRAAALRTSVLNLKRDAERATAGLVPNANDSPENGLAFP